MKTMFSAVTVALATSIASVATAADADPASRQLQIYPKNVARQHLGSNLFLYNPTSQTYAPTEAAAAWLDDDATTAWPIMAGKQYYLVSFAEPQLITNFSVSARPAAGTITLYAGDEPQPPGAKTWTAIARDIQIEDINQKKLARPFNRLAKYLLIESDIADPGPMYSIYVYTDRPAVSYDLVKREVPIDPRSFFGAYTNDQTSISQSGLYSQARVRHAGSSDSFLGWHKIIDDNPESGIAINPSTEVSGLIIDLNKSATISRVAVLTDGTAKGKLELFMVPSPAVASADEPAVIQVSNTPAGAPAAMSLEGMTPTVTLAMDGTTPRTSLDFAPTQAGSIVARWVPDNGTDPLVLREVNAFNGASLAEYEVAPNLEAVAELLSDASKDGKTFKDHKEWVGEGPEEVGELLPSPYLPGSLGFPPTLLRRVPPPRTPPQENPVSP